MVQPQIVRKSLTDMVAPLVRDLIISGELQPGMKVPEAELCLRFGVSRTPLREALKVLAAEGLVTLHPNRGATVAVITAAEVAALFPIIGALEALGGELAMMMLTDEDSTALEALHTEIVRRFKKRDWLGYAKANQAFHARLMAASGNSALAALYEQMTIRIHAIRFVMRRSDARWSEAVEDHERMMIAIRKRHGPALGKILKQHLVHKADMVMEALAAPDAPQ